MLSVALRSLPQDACEERGPPRYRLLTEAVAQSLNAPDLSVTVHNLSATGLLLHLSTRLEIGSTVLIAIPIIGEVEARIVWSSGGYHGAEFTHQLPAAAVEACLAESKVIWPAFANVDKPSRQARSGRSEGLAAEERASTSSAGDAGWPPARRIQAMLCSSALLWFTLLATARAIFG